VTAQVNIGVQTNGTLLRLPFANPKFPPAIRVLGRLPGVFVMSGLGC
jgi:hypothetical protein